MITNAQFINRKLKYLPMTTTIAKTCQKTKKLTHLGALDVIMQVVSECVNQIYCIFTNLFICVPWFQNCKNQGGLLFLKFKFQRHQSNGALPINYFSTKRFEI